MDDEVTEHQLHGLVAAIRREDAAMARRRARWQREAGRHGLSLRGVLAGAADGTPADEVALALAGPGPALQGAIVALGDDHVLIAEATGGRAFVALRSIEAVRVAGATLDEVVGAEAHEQPTGAGALASELGRHLATALEALAPLGAQVRTESGRWVLGRLVAVGADVVVVEGDEGLEAVSLPSVAVVRIEAPGAPGGPAQSSSPPLSPLPTTSG